jgi:nitroimidazol reductase NimA-like FMN-containing flavoprotein (pyridoxamine 5'-phosphate oxidase superfamily)
MELSPEEAQAMLAEPHVAVVAVESRGGPPLAVPVWYAYEPGGNLWLVTGTDSRKLRLLRRAGRCTLVVDTIEPRLRYTSVDCELVEERPVTDEERLELATRYLGAQQARPYVARVVAEAPPESRVTLRPTRWRTADLTDG